MNATTTAALDRRLCSRCGVTNAEASTHDSQSEERGAVLVWDNGEEHPSHAVCFINLRGALADDAERVLEVTQAGGHVVAIVGQVTWRGGEPQRLGDVVHRYEVEDTLVLDEIGALALRELVVPWAEAAVADAQRLLDEHPVRRAPRIRQLSVVEGTRDIPMFQGVRARYEEVASLASHHGVEIPALPTVPSGTRRG